LHAEGFPITWRRYLVHTSGKRWTVMAKTFQYFLREESDNLMISVFIRRLSCKNAHPLEFSAFTTLPPVIKKLILLLANYPPLQNSVAHSFRNTGLFRQTAFPWHTSMKLKNFLS
jgi:hypothetical protein